MYASFVFDKCIIREGEEEGLDKIAVKTNYLLEVYYFLLTPTLRNSVPYTYTEGGTSHDDSK